MGFCSHLNNRAPQLKKCRTTFKNRHFDTNDMMETAFQAVLNTFTEMGYLEAIKW
jgi:hypothetical protein